MPVTTTLSRLFYDRLGEPIANEIMGWFNAVDQTYRTELRELNELNFARFDAKLARRLAETTAALERRLAEFEVRVGRRFSQTAGKIDQLDATLERRLGDQTRWIFLAWTTLIMTIAGLLARR